MTGEHRTSSRFKALVRPDQALLVIYGDADERSLVRGMLEQDPTTRYLITEAVSGSDGLAHVRADRFDCVLVDADLPDGSLTDFLEQLGMIADLGKLPVVVSVRGDGDSLIEQAFRAGAVDFIVRERTSALDLGRTLRYAAERARFQNMRSELARSQRLMSLGQVAASVAHEINNPAAFILGNLIASQRTLDVLARLTSHVPETDRILADLISLTQDNIDGIRRIATIVDEMRVLSHPRTDAVELVDLDDVIRIAVKLLGKKLDAGHLTIDTAPIPRICADRGRLIQVFINLLDNAAMALSLATGPRQLQILAGVVGEFAEIRIVDTGSGMPPEVAARAFEPFFTTKAEGLGTGLGLSICAEYVHLHSGEISLESEVGFGTTVVVRLPLNTGLTPKSERTLNPRALETARSTVVIVDDEAPLLRSFSRVLAQHHSVVTFERAKDALTAIRGGLESHAIVCDVNMPDCDGPAFYRELLEFAPELARQVIFCTGGSFTANSRKLLMETGVEVLTKPVAPETLLHAIAKVARREEAAGVVA